MNPGIISYYLDKRMTESGHCEGYAVRIRHYVVAPSATLNIPAWNEIFVLLDEAQDVRIESDLGVYDISFSEAISEQQHEHTGNITLKNLTTDCYSHVRFVQAIPIEKNPDCRDCCNQ